MTTPQRHGAIRFGGSSTLAGPLMDARARNEQLAADLERERELRMAAERALHAACAHLRTAPAEPARGYEVAQVPGHRGWVAFPRGTEINWQAIRRAFPS